MLIEKRARIALHLSDEEWKDLRILLNAAKTYFENAAHESSVGDEPGDAAFARDCRMRARQCDMLLKRSPDLLQGSEGWTGEVSWNVPGLPDSSAISPELEQFLRSFGTGLRG